MLIYIFIFVCVCVCVCVCVSGEPQFSYRTLIIRSLSWIHNVTQSRFLENRCEQRKMKRISEVLEFFQSEAVWTNGWSIEPHQPCPVSSSLSVPQLEIKIKEYMWYTGVKDIRNAIPQDLIRFESWVRKRVSKLFWDFSPHWLITKKNWCLWKRQYPGKPLS